MKFGSIVKIIDKGYFIIVDSDRMKNDQKAHFKFDLNSENIYMYAIMPELGPNLDQLFNVSDVDYTADCIYSMGIQLLNIIEKVHKTGLVYNDLKLDNLVLDYNTDVEALK